MKHIQNMDALLGTGIGSTHVDGIAYGEDTGPVRIKFRSNSKNEWVLLGVPKASNRKNIDDFTQGFLSSDFKFTLRLQLANERRARLSLIRSAYLIAFQYLGYGFLLNYNLLRLRYQFNNPDENVYPTQAVTLPFEQGEAFRGINVIVSPKELKCYFVVFDIKKENGTKQSVGVMLPGPNVRDYKMFTNHGTFTETVTLRHYDIKWLDKIDQPHLAHMIWNNSHDN